MKNGSKKVRALAAIERLEGRAVPATGVSAYYSYDGAGNNLANPDWGAGGTEFLRIAAAAYADGLAAPAGAERPSARAVSNAVSDQAGGDLTSARLLSAMIYAWGQFIDHDLDRTVGGSAEWFPVVVPQGDPSFDPAGTGTKVIPLVRSAYDPDTGVSTPREQVNGISAWLDGSMVYGSDAETAAALRTFEGGRLKEGEGGLLPTNDAATFPGGTLDMENDANRVPDDRLFAAGDARANENVELTAIHTLFLREHNRLADAARAADPSLTDEQIYQKARAGVIASIQAITYNEWLPALLGPGAIAPYSGYDPAVNPGISNEFATAAFRFGHSLLGDDVEFLDDDGLPVTEGVPLADAFSNPDLLRAQGIDSVLKYLASDPAGEVDPLVVDGVRNFLFGPPGSGGLDLASLNIQRGRDHGIADYNTVREAVGLPRVTSFAGITSDPGLQQALASIYSSVDDVDLWVGGLAEDHVPGGSVGVTFRAILADQFTRLRDGDRFWYENVLSGSELAEAQRTTMSDLIARNTGLSNLQDNSFVFNVGVPGVVFADGNRDGRQGRNERGVAGATVELLDAGSGEVVATTTTDAAGRYDFGVAEGVRTGAYAVRVTPPPTGRGAAPAPLTSAAVSVTRGDEFPSVSVGLAAPDGGPRFNPGRPGNRNGNGNDGKGVSPRFVHGPTARPAAAPRPAPPQGRPRGAPEVRARSAVTRSVFDGVRQEMLTRAREVLGPARYAAFAAGLEGRRDAGRE